MIDIGWWLDPCDQRRIPPPGRCRHIGPSSNLDYRVCRSQPPSVTGAPVAAIGRGEFGGLGDVPGPTGAGLGEPYALKCKPLSVVVLSAPTTTVLPLA